MARVTMRAVEVVSVRFGAIAIFLTKIRGDFSPLPAWFNQPNLNVR
jgi:hypothetical protein